MIPASISVIICAYALDRWDDLTAAVHSVRQQDAPADEIIVVIDHNPALLDLVREWMPDVVAVENRQTRGLAGARNSGLAVAQSDVIAFLDDDAQAAPDWLARLRNGYEDPQVSGVGGAIEPAWQTGRPAWFPVEFDWVVGCTYRGMPESTAPVRNLIGANMSFRRSVFEAAGGFRTGIGRVGAVPVGCEETEFCIRVNQRLPGTIFLYEPDARITHHVPASRATWAYYRGRCHAEGRSKVLVSRYVGRIDGLSSERAYTFATLPSGIARGAWSALRRRQWSGFTQAGAIVAGLAITTIGYISGHAVRTSGSSAPAAMVHLSPAFVDRPRASPAWPADGVAADPVFEIEPQVVSRN